MAQDVWKAKGEQLERYLRMDTFPLGVNLLKKGDAFPEKTATPSSMGIKIAVCQATNIARRWGWSIGVTKDDIKCIPALISFGWREPESPDAVIDYLMSMAYFETKDAAIKTLRKMTIMEPNRFEKLYISPLAKTKLDPDVVVIYGNPAQMMRLTQDHEMAFSLPASQADDLITGLEATHKGGSRYPVQSYLLFETMHILQLEELEKRLKP